MVSIEEQLESLTPRQKKLYLQRKQQRDDLNKLKRTLLTLQAGDSNCKAPVFCTHSPEGVTGHLISIVRHLDPGQSVYGLQSPAFYGLRDPFDDIGEMSSHNLKLVKSIQPTGPYFFFGHSSGANAALQMAIDLELEGHQSTLFLMDSHAPIGPAGKFIDDLVAAGNDIYDDIELVYAFAFNAGLVHNTKIDFTLQDLQSLSRDKVYERVATFMIKTGYLPVNAEPQMIDLLLKMFLYHARADYNYHRKNSPAGPDKKFGGKIILFRGDQKTVFAGTGLVVEPDNSPSSNWDSFCSGEIEVITVEGANHTSIILEPSAEKIGQIIQKELD